jgi:hypothetical protein
MKILIVTILLAATIPFCLAESLPANLSREPNCIKDTYCLKITDQYIDNETLPAGFEREPKCNEAVHLACVSNQLYLEAKEFLQIKTLILKEVKDLLPAKIKYDYVMSGVIKVTIEKKHYFRKEFLLEIDKTHNWVIFRKSFIIY